jgi:hypothetical protein
MVVIEDKSGYGRQRIGLGGVDGRVWLSKIDQNI